MCSDFYGPVIFAGFLNNEEHEGHEDRHSEVLSPLSSVPISEICG